MDDLTQLALRAQRGDDESLAELIRRTQPDVWWMCAHVAGRERADDLTQETFLRAWRALPRYRSEAGVRSWLLAIARNTAVDGLRAASRRPVGGAALAESLVPHAPDPANLVATHQLFDSLDPDRRTALFLTQLLGLSYAEAAVVCGVPVGTIRSRIARGRADLLGDLESASGS